MLSDSQEPRYCEIMDSACDVANKIEPCYLCSVNALLSLVFLPSNRKSIIMLQVLVLVSSFIMDMVSKEWKSWFEYTYKDY